MEASMYNIKIRRNYSILVYGYRGGGIGVNKII